MRTVRVFVIAIGVLMVLAGPAIAQSYPPDTTVVAGRTIERDPAVASPVADPVVDPNGEVTEVLASTGGPVTVGSVLAAGLLLVGTGAVVAARRREQHRRA